MRRLVSRLIGIGIALAIGWFLYQMDDVTGCDGPGSSDWFESTLVRLDEATADYGAWDEYSPAVAFDDYVVRAEERYQTQLSQKTVGCLETLQEQVTEFLHLEWRMYEAASEGNYELANQYDLESYDADNAVSEEFDRLAEKYGWEIEE